MTGDRTRRTFSLLEGTAILARTPRLLDVWLRDLPDGWINCNEGNDTWSPFDVVGHLIHGERTDWMPRVRRVLESGESAPFDPFDRQAQFRESNGKSMAVLLDEFARLRQRNLQDLGALGLDAATLDRRGVHPAFGPVTLRQLLATWIAHDLDHVIQIARVMGTQYSDEVGPWRQYLRIISGTQG
jgi:hypothetical protein